MVPSVYMFKVFTKFKGYVTDVMGLDKMVICVTTGLKTNLMCTA